MEWAILVVAAALQAVAVQCILNTTSVVTEPDGFSIYPCLQVNHREPELDNSVMGLWYVIEMVQHRDEPKNRGQQTSDVCPRLTLYKESTTTIRLMWQEKSGDINYKFKMSDPENSGYWLAWGRQNGSMLIKGYEQFAGSVQVMEAHPTEMVLTFCVNQRQHYSVILKRNAAATYDTYNVRRLLSGFGLPEVGVRQMCSDAHSIAGSASKSIPPMVILTSSLLLFMSRRH